MLLLLNWNNLLQIVDISQRQEILPSWRGPRKNDGAFLIQDCVLLLWLQPLFQLTTMNGVWSICTSPVYHNEGIHQPRVCRLRSPCSSSWWSTCRFLPRLDRLVTTIDNVCLFLSSSACFNLSFVVQHALLQIFIRSVHHIYLGLFPFNPSIMGRQMGWLESSPLMVNCSYCWHSLHNFSFWYARWINLLRDGNCHQLLSANILRRQVHLKDHKETKAVWPAGEYLNVW